MKIEQNISLAEFTTLGLGGAARYFGVAKSVADIKEALTFAQEKKVGVHILGGGSNTVFPDQGLACLVVKLELSGVSFTEKDGQTLVSVAAGEDWDHLVKTCVNKGLAGIECLAGIPGLAGATPVQNVGAYGQEVAETITTVKAINRATGEEVEFSNQECEFGYRTSRFKTGDLGKYIITEVTYRLTPNGAPAVKYPELKNAVAAKGIVTLQTVRETVLELRAKKSMIINPQDPNSRSVGSFFTNPTLTEADWTRLKKRWQESGAPGSIPIFPSGDKMKLSAAWLVEHAGFAKGHTAGGVGISTNHALALVNKSGTTKDLLALASSIEKSVYEKFGIKLEREPYVAGDRSN